MDENDKLTAGRDQLPVQREKRVADAMAAFLPAYDKLRDGVVERRPADMREGLEMVGGMDVAGLAASLEALPLANTLDIVVAASGLIAVTKHLDKVDGAAFQDALVRFIADEQPTRLGLAIAMRRVLLSARFTPSIAEVIETLRAVESDLRSVKQRLAWLPDRVKEAETCLQNVATAV